MLKFLLTYTPIILLLPLPLLLNCAYSYWSTKKGLGKYVEKSLETSIRRNSKKSAFWHSPYFTKSALYQLNNDSPSPSPRRSQGTGCFSEPWTVQDAKEDKGNNSNCKEHAYWAQSEFFIRSRQLIKVIGSDLMFEELNSSKPFRSCI